MTSRLYRSFWPAGNPFPFVWARAGNTKKHATDSTARNFFMDSLLGDRMRHALISRRAAGVTATRAERCRIASNPKTPNRADFGGWMDPTSVLKQSGTARLLDCSLQSFAEIQPLNVRARLTGQPPNYSKLVTDGWRDNET